MGPEFQFYVLVLVSFAAFAGILKYVLRKRSVSLSAAKTVSVAAVVVVGGMLFARFGARSGMPWWIYYTVPMLLTVFLPPVVYSMSSRETMKYMVLAFLSAPVIHIVFSFLFGWREYIPFLRIPSLQELLGAG